MEPRYDSDSYPQAIDWRNMGAVTDVHSQGNCGACWAITAVETVESAYYIKKNTLLDLAETEVILCDDTCEMCNGESIYQLSVDLLISRKLKVLTSPLFIGGWPQNAYEYVMDNNGLPTDGDIPYDGDVLMAITSFYEGGDSYGLTYSDVSAYEQAICPSGGRGSGSKKNNNNNNYSGAQRYGKIKGYGYSTERCICYTDGTGCNCEDQNERLAIMNVATYGPATVCLDAASWQDYAGGIMTAEIGCSSAFLDMNHCVQVVGYAFSDTSGNDNEYAGGQQQSHSNSGGSRDDGNRKGYWIVRNQWSSSWAMNGYAYVAMGANTCGILNDMTQAYM
jgi:hypothetical protein